MRRVKCFGFLLVLPLVGLLVSIFLATPVSAGSQGNTSMKWIDGKGVQHTINPYGVTEVILDSSIYFQIRGFYVGYANSFPADSNVDICFSYRTQDNFLTIGNMFARGDNRDDYYIYDHIIYTQSGAWRTTTSNSSGQPVVTLEQEHSVVNDCYKIHILNSTNYFQLEGGAINQSEVTFVDVYGQINANYYTPSDPASEELKRQDEKDEQDRSNMETQQGDVSSDSSDSQSDAQSTGTTLLGAFTSFVTAVTNATPSNCTLDMDLGNLDLGNVDFCELDPPQGFSSIASIFLILFCVPLSFSTARKVISLFRSFQ